MNKRVDKDIKCAITMMDEFEDLENQLYTFSNEHIKKYYNYMDLTNKKTLCVTASGDHILYSVLAGSSDITSCDINPLSKYYAKLKIAMIKCYDEKHFNEYTDYYFGIDKKINLDDLKKYLDDETYYFWKHVLYSRCYNAFLYRTDSGTKEEYPNYNLLKEKLFDCKITFIDKDITKLGKRHNNKYGAIFLSNIFDWMPFCNTYETLKTISNYLTPDGVMYDVKVNGSYLYHDKDFEIAPSDIVLSRAKLSNNTKVVDKWVDIYSKKYFI